MKVRKSIILVVFSVRVLICVSMHSPEKERKIFDALGISENFEIFYQKWCFLNDIIYQNLFEK